MPRPYKVWGYPWVPVLFCIIAAAIVANTVVNDFKNSFWGLLVVLTGPPGLPFLVPPLTGATRWTDSDRGFR